MKNRQRKAKLNGCEAKFEAAEKAMDLMLKRLDKLNERLREQPPLDVDTSDLPEALQFPLPLMVAEK